MKKQFKFHQFVVLEKGPVNTAILDFLTGDIFQEKTELVNKFHNNRFSLNWSFFKELKKEEIIISINENSWMPSINLNNNFKENKSLILEIDCDVNLYTLKKYFKDVSILKIIYYGKENIHNYFPHINVEFKQKSKESCIAKANVSNSINNVNKSYYCFSKYYNSCWGKKIAITNENVIKPCIHSNIKVDTINNTEAKGIPQKMSKYWFLTKNFIKKCNICELKYVCFDCRVVALEKTGDLNGENPLCKYDPYSGKWEE